MTDTLVQQNLSDILLQQNLYKMEHKHQFTITRIFPQFCVHVHNTLKQSHAQM